MSSVDGLFSLAPFETSVYQGTVQEPPLLVGDRRLWLSLTQAFRKGGRGDRQIFETNFWELRSRKLTKALHCGRGDQYWFGRMLTLIPLESCLNMERRILSAIINNKKDSYLCIHQIGWFENYLSSDMIWLKSKWVDNLTCTFLFREQNHCPVS